MRSGTLIGSTCSFPGTIVTFACGKTCFKNSALFGLTIPSLSLWKMKTGKFRRFTDSLDSLIDKSLKRKSVVFK